MSRVLNGDRAQIGSRQLAEIYQALVPITNAQLKALPTTPVDLVAAPGAGLRNIPLMVQLLGNFSAGAYTNIHAAAALGSHPYIYAADELEEIFTDDIGNVTSPALTDLTDFLTAAGRAEASLNKFSWGGHAYGSAITTGSMNKKLQLFGNNRGSGDWTGGHASNTLSAFVLYLIVSAP